MQFCKNGQNHVPIRSENKRWAIGKFRLKNKNKQKQFEILPNFLFRSTIVLLTTGILKYYFIQMAATTGLTEAHSVRPNFKFLKP